MPPENAPKKKDLRAWDALTPPLSDFILDAVQSMGFSRMTPVQAAVLPLFRKNSDVVVEAVTGSGKTLAFLLPILERILRSEESLKKHYVTGIIVSPTRELAIQIHNVLLSILAFHPASAEILPCLKTEEKRPTTTEPVIVPQLVVGGSTKPQADLAFFVRHSPNLVVATPGRLAELLASPHVHTSSLEVLVLDEADRLLDLGFKGDLQRILGYLPKQRRTGLFSASMSEAVNELIRVGLRNPQRVAVTVKSLKDGGVVEERKTPASLQMTYVITPASKKFPTLMQLLTKVEPRPSKSIVFLSTCFAVKYFHRVLPALLPNGFNLIPLHGKLEPQVRERNFAAFMSSSTPTVLLTTDVAARGLDIPSVDLVVQVDPPSDPKTYMHRAGRAGRAGRRGLAVVFLMPGREEDFLPFMEIRKTPLKPLKTPVLDVSQEEAESASKKIRKQAQADREVFQMAQRAFVSWVRSFLAHRATSIFRVTDLDWVDLAAGFGLLQLPKMPELKGLDIDRALGLDIDVEAITFKDKSKEKKRQAEIAEREANKDDIDAAAAQRAQKRRKNEAWSEKHERAETRVARREKKQRKREAARLASMTDVEKEEQKKLDKMIEEIRQHNEQQKAGAAEDDSFEGFGN